MNSAKPQEKWSPSMSFCPNCAKSLLLCPCRVIPQGAHGVGMKVLNLPAYYSWRVRRFEERFGVSPEKAVPKSEAMRRALNNLGVLKRKVGRQAREV